MPANDLWALQFADKAKECDRLFETFKTTEEVENLDRAMLIFDECSHVYGLEALDFEDFLMIGKSLRARQASLQKKR